MNKFFVVTFVSSLLLPVGFASAASVSEREYKRGYNDCLAGNYDQYQHGASYKRGCRAAEDSGNSTGHTVKDKANVDNMKAVCGGAVHGRFGSYLMSANFSTVEHQKSGWQVYGSAVMDDGAVSEFVCMFSSAGHLKRVNASDPSGGIAEMDHEGYCPPDVSEANRYQYPGCN